MKAIKIGSFDAKTHFSKLLQDVEKGETFEILRRGKPVAHLLGINDDANPRAGAEALACFRVMRRRLSISRADILNWINEGRR